MKPICFYKNQPNFVVLKFEVIGLILNYQFSSIFFKETPKFEACMNTYFLEVVDQIWKKMDKVLIFQEFLIMLIIQHS